MESGTKQTQKLRKKVLILITKSMWGGAQRYIYDLATRLPKQSYDVCVAAGGDGPLFHKLASAGVRTAHLPSLDRDVSIGNDVRSFLEIMSLLAKERPDIVHVNSSKAAGIGALAARLRRVRRIIFTVHGWPHRERISFISRLIRLFFSWITVLLSHATITLSHRECDQGMRMWFCEKKIMLVPNGIEIPAFANRNDARTILSRASGHTITESEFLIGTVAELHQNKGLASAVRAMRIIIHEYPDATYLIVGEGEEGPNLKSLVTELDLSRSVFFAGHVDGAEKYMTAFDVFLLPSFKEGLPYVLLEAGAAGVPLVASDVGGVSDIVTQCESGILVRPGNEKEIAQAVNVLVRDGSKRALYGARIKSEIKERFSVEKMIASTSRLYSALV